MGTLSPEEIKIAEATAYARTVENQINKTCSFDKEAFRAYKNHLMGVATELYIARSFNIAWSGQYFDHRDIIEHVSDVGYLEIKSVREYDDRIGYIVLNPQHNKHEPNLLVCLKSGSVRGGRLYDPKLRVLGWEYGDVIWERGFYKWSQKKHSKWLHHSELQKIAQSEEFMQHIRKSRKDYGKFELKLPDVDLDFDKFFKTKRLCGKSLSMR